MWDEVDPVYNKGVETFEFYNFRQRRPNLSRKRQKTLYFQSFNVFMHF